MFTDEGEAVNFTGGFGFETTGDNPVRGYYGNWGVWLDTESAVFSPSNAEVAIQSFTAGSDAPVARSLNWSGGALYRVENLTEPLEDGFEFMTFYADWDTFTFTEVNARYSTTDHKFVYHSIEDDSVVGELTAQDAQQNPWEAEFWSNEKMEMVRWDYAAALLDTPVDQIVFTQTTNVADLDEFLGNENLPVFKNVESGAPNANYPLSYSTFNGEDTNFKNGDTDTQTYILSGSNPGGDFEARALYLQTGTDNTALDAGDTPVRFDFSMSFNSWDCTDPMCMGRYTPFADGAATADYTDWKWPYETVRLYNTADTNCQSDINDSQCVHYEWRYGANVWDNSILVFENSNIVRVSKPIRFSYDHVAANERNGDSSFTLQDDGGFAVDTVVGNGSTTYSVSADTFDNTTFLLEYDGTSLHGLPMTFDMSGDDWGKMVALVNLEDGTQLQANDGTFYRVKATEISQSFNPVDEQDCVDAGVAFSNPTELGISFDDVPDIENQTEYPRPTELLADAPSDDALVCTVTHGDPGNCDVPVTTE